MSTSSHFDFAVIGGGSAGYAAARTAVQLGLGTVVIDHASELGGLCILRGCMPSKTLIESANRNLTLRRASEFGLPPTAGKPDLPAILERKRLLIQNFASYRQQQLQDGRFELIRAKASFTSASPELLELKLDYPDHTQSFISATSVLIATGSAISIPNIPGLKETGFWTSDTLLEAEDVPENITILGGGTIALEFAHYLEGIGRKVSIVQRSPQLLSGFDPDIAEVIAESFTARGIQVYTDTQLQNIEKVSGRKHVNFVDLTKHDTVSLPSDEILVALGRKPAIQNLELGSVGIVLHANGQVIVNQHQSTSHPRVFAAGDVCGPLEVVHLAVLQGEVAAKNAAALLAGEKPQHEMDYRSILYGIFTEPQIAVVGLSETEAVEKNIPYIASSYPFDDHGKSMVMGETEGFVKLIADPFSGKLLGAAVVGPEATELIHQPALAIHLNATAEQFLSAPWYHPTLSEIWSYPAEEIIDLVTGQNLP